jgi:ABC-type sugar transport system substrate-binding protein
MTGLPRCSGIKLIRAWGIGLLAASAVLLPVGCGGGDEGSSQAVGNVRVAAVIKALDNPFFVTMRNGLVATARRHDLQLRVAAASAAAQDTTGQATDLEHLAAGHPSCFVVNPLSPTNLIPALAHLPGNSPIVNIDSPVDKEAAKAVGAEITSYIGTDNVAAGALAADMMARLVDRGARVGIIKGIPNDATSDARASGFNEGIDGRFQVVETVAADFERAKARSATEELLRADPRIDGFFAVNDLMALGVADALRSAGKGGEVAVVGFDGIHEALSAVKSGALSATVSQYPYSVGQLAVEACLAAARGESVPANVDAPVQVVTKDNVARALATFPRPPERFDDPFAN